MTLTCGLPCISMVWKVPFRSEIEVFAPKLLPSFGLFIARSACPACPAQGHLIDFNLQGYGRSAFGIISLRALRAVPIYNGGFDAFILPKMS